MMSMILLLSSLTINAQVAETSLSVTGGYSWINGVIGAEYRVNQFALSGGWMPTTMPMSGDKINSFGFTFTAYSGKPSDISTWYASFGIASQGYREETSSNYGYSDYLTAPMYVVMVGDRYDFGKAYMKLGIGYGWCEYAGTFAWEALIGFPLFKNY